MRVPLRDRVLAVHIDESQLSQNRWAQKGETMHTLVRIGPQGLRQLLRQPGSSTLAVLALALGIAGTTTVSSVVHAVLLKSFPSPESERVVSFWDAGSWSAAEIEAMQRHAGAFSKISGHGQPSVTLTGRLEPVQLSAVFVSANLFSQRRRPPALGSPFDSRRSRPGAHRVVVLSHGLWREESGEDAMIFPARRATRLDPIRALRREWA